MYDFGMKNIVLRNFKSSIDSGNCKSIEDIHSVINNWNEQIKDVESEMIALFELQSSCEHEYDKATYTCEKRLLNYVYVYKRICTNCGKIERVQVDEESQKPEWAMYATKKYHNNFI